MKHRNLLKTMLLLCDLIAGTSMSWAATTTYQHVFNAKPSTGSNVTLSSVNWNISATQLGSYNSANYAGVQLGSKSNNGSITLTSSSAWGTESGTYKDKTIITEVRLWLNLGGTSVTPTVTIGGKSATSDGTTVVKNSSAGSDWTKATKVTFTPALDGNTGVVVISVSTEKAGYICCMEIDCEEDAGGTTPSDLALTGAPVALSFDLYDDYSPKAVTYTTSSTGAVSVSGGTGYVTTSVNESTKTITVTPTAVTASAQTITVSQAADETYAAGSVTFTVSVANSTPVQTFKKITSAGDLATGDELLFVYESGSGNKAAGTIGSNAYLASVSVDIEGDDDDEIKVAAGDAVNVFVLGGKADAWTLYSKMDDGYLTETSVKNLSIGADVSTWTISIDATEATVSAPNGNLQYNSSSPRFTTYATSQGAIQLYRKVVDRTALSVGAAGFTTYVTKMDATFPAGVTAYIATAVGTNVTLTSVASAPANTAVIIEADEDDYNVTTALSPADVTGNLLKASDGFVAGDGTTIYALGNKSGVGFYLVKSGVKVPVGKAYLTVSGSGVKEFLPFDFNEADGISLTPALSEGEGAIYNLAGQRLSKMQKGINIINGKKVLR